MTNQINFDLVGSLINFLRKEAGMTQAELAAALNVTKPAISQWESGQGIKTEKLYEIARFFGITVSELLAGRLDEEEEDYLARNYDLGKFPYFSSVDEENLDDIMDYLSRCKKVIHRLFELFDAFLKDDLDEKEQREFSYLFRYVGWASDYYSGVSASLNIEFLRNTVDVLSKEVNINDKTLLDYELSKIFSFEFNFLPETILASNDKALTQAYLELLNQQQKDDLLTKFVKDKTDDEIEKTKAVRWLLEAGARYLFNGKTATPYRRQFDMEEFQELGLQGAVVLDEKKTRALALFGRELENKTGRSADYFHWKSFTYAEYEDLIDWQRTEDIRKIVFLKDQDPCAYYEYIKNRDWNLLHPKKAGKA